MSGAIACLWPGKCLCRFGELDHFESVSNPVGYLPSVAISLIFVPRQFGALRIGYSARDFYAALPEALHGADEHSGNVVA